MGFVQWLQLTSGHVDLDICGKSSKNSGGPSCVVSRRSARPYTDAVTAGARLGFPVSIADRHTVSTHVVGLASHAAGHIRWS